jgi:Uma2 family endonuclease
MNKALTTIGPADQGRRMTLAEFENLEGEEGHLYELSRGVITVVDVPNPRHLALIVAIRRVLHAHDAAHPGRIHTIASGGECKLLIEGLESERHPVVAVYKTPPPEAESDSELWSQWIPEIVVEVISPSSRYRDHEEKAEEYLRFGVREYWIVDPEDGMLKVLRRSRGRWAELLVRPPSVYRTKLLPGLELEIAAVLEAARSR